MRKSYLRNSRNLKITVIWWSHLVYYSPSRLRIVNTDYDSRQNRPTAKIQKKFAKIRSVWRKLHRNVRTDEDIASVREGVGKIMYANVSIPWPFATIGSRYLIFNSPIKNRTYVTFEASCAHSRCHIPEENVKLLWKSLHSEKENVWWALWWAGTSLDPVFSFSVLKVTLEQLLRTIQATVALR